MPPPRSRRTPGPYFSGRVGNPIEDVLGEYEVLARRSAKLRNVYFDYLDVCKVARAAFLETTFWMILGMSLEALEAAQRRVPGSDGLTRRSASREEQTPSQDL